MKKHNGYYREDTHNINDTPAREIAALLITVLHTKGYLKNKDIQGLPYYTLEDLLTHVINKKFKLLEETMNEEGKNKFKIGQVVLYTNKNELAEIKDIIEHEIVERRHLKQDGIHGPSTGEEYTKKVFSYRIWTHTGETSALCREEFLKEIPNAYAFHIRRRHAEEKLELTGAFEALQYINSFVEQLTNLPLVGIPGDKYEHAAYVSSEPGVQEEDTIRYAIVKALRELLYGKH